MGDEEREGAARSQHVVLQGPADARTMGAAMRPGVERSREVQGTNAAPACLVVTPSIEQAHVAADQARVLLDDETSRVVPVSHVARARRVLAAGPVAVVTGTATDLLALRRDAALNVDQVKAIVMIGLDDILAEGDVQALEALLGDLPADGMRVATLDSETPAVTTFLDAQLRRARRIAPPPAGESPLPVTPTYLLTSDAGRSNALAAVLDAVDPPSLVVVATNDPSAADAHRALTRLGLVVDGVLVQVVKQPTSQHVSLVVLWDAPASAEALAEALATKPVDAVAFLTPEELPAFRRLTHGAAAAWSPPARRAGAASRVQRLRVAIEETLQHGGGATASELSLLTPLLDRFDAVEIAAAALRLYETALRDMTAVKLAAAQTVARQEAPRARGLTVMTGGAGGASGTRIFLAVGKRDAVRVGDIVGAVANEAGIDGDRIGAVEMFESHTTVALSPEDAARAVAALADTTLRGRRLSARIDERGDRGAERGGERKPARSFGPPRSGARGDRGDRGERPAPRGRPMTRGDDRGADSRGAPRGAGRTGGPRASERAGGERSDRGAPRGGARGTFGAATEARRAFGDRPARERTEGTSEWSQRGERMKHAKRTPRPRPDAEE